MKPPDTDGVGSPLLCQPQNPGEQRRPSRPAEIYQVDCDGFTSKNRAHLQEDAEMN